MMNLRRNPKPSQSGNIFFMLFASVALVGAFGVGASNVMKGLVSSMSDVTRKTIAEEKMASGARLAIQNATVTQGTGGDCDGDALTETDLLVEPLPFRSAGTLPHPAGGGHLPLEIGATLSDPWGTPYGYCAWDPGTVRDAATCGGPGANRRIGMGIDNQAGAGLVVAVISAGKDRRFTTSCNDFVDLNADLVPDTPMIGRGVGGDDIIFEYTYTEANGLSGDDLWRVKDTQPDTALIAKNVEISGDASMEGVLELRRRGLLLPDENETGLCTALNEAELRVNTGSSPPVLEICYDTQWVPISMGQGGGGEGSGVCGEDWVLQTSPQNGAGADVAYGNNLYVSVGAWPGYIMTSPDGITWTNRSLPPNFDDPSSIVYANGIFVMTGLSSIDRIATSVDGIAWTNRTAGWTNLNSVTYGNGLFVAYGADGYIVTSPDGITWTQRSSTADDWRGLIYAGGKWVAAAGPPTWNVATSNDGITWTIQPGTNSPYGRLSYGENLYIGANGDQFKYSSDGISWTNVNVGTGGWAPIIYTSTGKFISANWSNGDIASSDDGVTWAVQANQLDPTKNWSGLVEGDRKLIATAMDGTVYTSYCDSQPPPEEDTLQIALPDPVAHYRLDERAGTAVYDRMNGPNGVLTGATSPDSYVGKIGRAQRLDGTDDRIVIPTPPRINSLSQFTYATWISPSTTGRYVFDNRDGGTRGVRISITASPNNRLQFEAGDGGLWRSATGITSAFSPPTWSHIAIAYSGSGTANVPVMYINGAPVALESATQPTSAFTNPTGNAVIGAAYGGATPLNGYIDDFRVYGQVLSPEQVGLLYNDVSSTVYTAPNPNAIVAAGKYRGKITAHENMACGIKEDGSAWCWGDEANGSMGDGPASPGGSGYVSPVRVQTLAGENSFLQISMGQNFACGIKTDREAWCWGSDSAGQLGNMLTGTQENPDIVNATGIGWTQISTGIYHACGIQRNGDLYCWGDNGSGQLGTNTGARTNPTIITEPGPWVQVSAGAYHTCAIKANGSAWCWGDQQYGRLGNGLTASATVDEATPVLEPGPWVKISRGGNHTCGVKLDGTAWCWGQATNGKLGLGLSSNHGMPQRVSEPRVQKLSAWIDIETSQTDDISCGIKADGSAWCWGTDSSGQLGNSTSPSSSTPSPVASPGPWSAITMGFNLTCGIKADGSAWCWGSDTNGRLGNGASVTGTQVSPTRVENFPNVTPFVFNDAQTILTRSAAATTVSLGENGGRIGYDAYSGGFGFTGAGRSILNNPIGNSGLSIESTGAFDSQVSWKTVSGATTRSIGVDNVTGNLEFGNNVAAVTDFMSSITPHMVVNRDNQVGIGTETPSAKLDIPGGGLRVGDDTRTCTLSRKGVLRYNGGAMQYCNGSAWASF